MINQWKTIPGWEFSHAGLETKNGSSLVLVSGGVDSMALLNLLTPRYRSKCHVLHFDHNLRNNSSQDAEFVVNECQRLGVSCTVHNIDASLLKGSPQGSQMAARNIRYQVAFQLMRANSLSWVCTAHTSDDHLETIYQQMLRQRGLQDRKGLMYARGSLLRPLMHIPKSKLRNWMLRNRKTWCEDSSNAQDTYQRNFVRNRVLNTSAQSLYVPWLTEVGNQGRSMYLEARRQLLARCGPSLTTVCALNIGELDRYLLPSVLATLASIKGLRLNKQQIVRVANTCLQKKGTMAFSVHRGIVRIIDSWVWILAYEELDLLALQVDQRRKKVRRLYLESLNLDEQTNVSIHKNIDVCMGRPNSGWFELLSGKKNVKNVFREHRIPVELRNDVLWICDEQKIVFEWSTRIRKNAIHLLP